MPETKIDRIKRREIRALLYRVKRKWGTPGDLYKVATAAPNYDTGTVGISLTKYHFRELISVSVQFIHKFEYDIGFLAANKNFTYGGFYQPGDRVAIIDGMDGLQIEMTDYFFINGLRYDPQKIERLDYNAGWFLHLRHTKGSTGKQIHERHVYNHLTIDQDITHDPL